MNSLTVYRIGQHFKSQFVYRSSIVSDHLNVNKIGSR